MSDDTTLDQAQLSQIRAVLAHYDLLHSNISKICTGLINTTYLIHADGGCKYILQGLNPMFPAALNKNIDRISRHLQGKGLSTPELIPTKDQALWFQQGQQTWRLLSYVEGEVHRRVSTPEIAEQAGILLGRVHVALFDFADELAAQPRPAAHHLAHHVQALSSTLHKKTAHTDYRAIAALGAEILAASRSLAQLPRARARVVHGDPKIDNFIFDRHSKKARCLVDLDTVGNMPLYRDLGDAMRSWCNPGGEDRPDGSFSLARFAAAVKGYAAATRGRIERDEWQAIVPATETLFLALAARFCADALNEDYFGWDADNFASHSEHSRIRAAGQLSAARSLSSQREQALAIVRSAFQE